MVMEVLELYYDPKIALVNLLNSYIEVLDTWVSELRRPERPKSEKKTLDTLKIKNEEEMYFINETNIPEIREAKHEAYEPHQESAEMYTRDNQ
ncbi:21482_t:CDS:2, partial [Gigaspora margarita]